MTRPRVLLVSASDTRFMPFLRGMIDSLQPVLASSAANSAMDIACFDLGLAPADKAWLGARHVTLATPRPHLGVGEGHPVALLSFLARPFLPEYFPGYDVYLWVDSDIWFQDPAVTDLYIRGALSHGMAITHERERAYRFQPWLLGWTSKHLLLGYGPFTSTFLLTRRHLNAGLFAVAAGAPQWAAWAERYAAAIRRTGALVPHDQFALNHALYGSGPNRRGEQATFLDPACNWICDRGIPMWNDAVGAFCKPYPPFAPIAALHLAGPAKRKVYTVRRTGGGEFRTCLMLGASPTRPVAGSPLDTVLAA